MRKDNLSVKGGAPVIRRRRRFTWDDLELTLLSLPSIVWLIAFCYVPMFGIVFAFKNYTEVDGNKVVARTEQGNSNWSMDGFVTGSVVNASCTTDSYYDWEEIFKDYENAIVSTLGTFTFDKTDVEAECAACSAVMEKYTAEMLTGTLDSDAKLETIKAELKVAGIDAVQDEAQAQLDAYLGK